MNATNLATAFVATCREVFGDRLEAIIQHGSSVKGGEIPGYSDIDFQIYLTSDCFDADAHLQDELCFSFQDAFALLPWSETGFSYGQVYFYDRHRLPAWWTGPAPNTYRELLGKLPDEAKPSTEDFRRSSVRALKELPKYVGADVTNFADTTTDQLPRRLRLLGTTLTPIVFALIAYDADDALAIWSRSKFEALEMLEARYRDMEGPPFARQFYEEIGALFGGKFEAERARHAFKTGVRFLRWAEAIGKTLPDTDVSPTSGRRR
ncbi:MAG: hypothetical protein GEU75_00605 [Dehalococcoidia bacterium]|nr:hypothetical protein [Dehalococcoidia bacterium]